MGTAAQLELDRNVSRVSFRIKIMYGVGEIANTVKVVIFGLYSLFFATMVLRLPGTWVGAVGFLTMFWDAIIDPFIGHFTDGPSASSRRLRCMWTGALTMGIGFWALFNPPQRLPAFSLLLWLFVASLAVRTATSMFSIPYYALGANLSRDYNERTSIAGIRGITSVIGTSLAASLSFILFFPEKVSGVDPKLQRAGYAAMGFWFGLLMTAVALVALSGIVLDRRHRAVNSETGGQPAAGFLASMRDAWGSPSFRVMWSSSFLSVIGLAVNSSLLLHYLTYYVKVSGSVALSSAQGAFYTGGLIGIVFWLRVARSFDKQRLYILSAGMTAVLILLALPLFGEGHPLGTGDVRPLLVGYFLAGFFNCVLWFLPQSMLADVADESELITGTRQEGAIFGVFSFGQQIATGVAVMLAGGLLEKFVGLVPGASKQSEVAVLRIGALYSIVPAVLFLSAAGLMLRYKLTRSRVQSIQTELRRRIERSGTLGLEGT